MNNIHLPPAIFAKLAALGNEFNVLLDISPSVIGTNVDDVVRFLLAPGNVPLGNVQISLVQHDREVRSFNVVRSIEEFEEVKRAIDPNGGGALQPALDFVRDKLNDRGTVVVTDGITDTIDTAALAHPVLVLSNHMCCPTGDVRPTNLTQHILGDEPPKPPQVPVYVLVLTRGGAARPISYTLDEAEAHAAQLRFQGNEDRLTGLNAQVKELQAGVDTYLRAVSANPLFRHVPLHGLSVQKTDELHAKYVALGITPQEQYELDNRGAGFTVELVCQQVHLEDQPGTTLAARLKGKHNYPTGIGRVYPSWADAVKMRETYAEHDRRVEAYRDGLKKARAVFKSFHIATGETSSEPLKDDEAMLAALGVPTHYFGDILSPSYAKKEFVVTGIPPLKDDNLQLARLQFPTRS